MSLLSCGCVEHTEDNDFFCPKTKFVHHPKCRRTLLNHWGLKCTWTKNGMLFYGEPNDPGHYDGGNMGPTSVRTFETGATRDTDTGKLDYEGFLSPEVLKRYAEYMHENRFQKDGSYRDSDNWQAGMPLAVYMKSMIRHVFDVWRTHRMRHNNPVFAATDRQIAQKSHEDALCAVLFNVMGYLRQEMRGGDPVVVDR